MNLPGPHETLSEREKKDEEILYRKMGRSYRDRLQKHKIGPWMSASIPAPLQE